MGCYETEKKNKSKIKPMNTDGKKLIASLCEKLQRDGIECTDTQIMILLRSLNRYEVNQLVSFGTVESWEREKEKALKLNQ